MRLFEESDLGKKYIEISRRLLQNSCGEHISENVVTSSFSLVMLLALALRATNGNSRNEIVKALSDELSMDDLMPTLKEFYQDCVSFFGTGEMKSSSCICVQEDLFSLIREEYKEFAIPAFQTEFFSADADMVEKVNAWVNEKTKGMIPTLLDDTTVGMVMAFVNALAFDAEWAECYEEDSVFEDGEFTNADGTVSQVTMLHSTEADFLEDDFYTGFVKYYKKKQFAFMGLLPKKAKSKNFFERALDQVDFKALYDTRTHKDVYVSMPEFEVSTVAELSEFCKQLGIKEIFTPAADFSRLIEGYPIMVSSIDQKACIKVNRKGTKAAAASDMVFTVGCAPDFDRFRNVTLDRPFVYAIINTETGLPVFSGVVNKL